MPLSQPSSEVLSRDVLIARLRHELSSRTDGDVSICRLAAEQGIFCKGFSRFSDSELRERVPWLVRKRPGATREELESLTDSWQLARQEACALPTACDVQSLEHDVCNGWNDFSTDELAGFYRELTGKLVSVRPT